MAIAREPGQPDPTQQPLPDPSMLPPGTVPPLNVQQPMQPAQSPTATTPPAGVKPLSPPSAPNINVIPSPDSAMGITQLPDGQGGAISVPPAPLAPPSVTTPMTPFSSTSNLIGQQINPTASTRLLDTQGMTDQALQQVLNGPDRFQLAQSKYDTFAQNNANQFGHALTDATNRAASHGQIGSGMLTNQYGDLTQQFQLADNSARSNFLNDALGGTIQDRLNNFGAAQSQANNIYGQEAAGRNELRGERGYQNDLAQQAIAQRVQQALLEQQGQGQSFNQGLDLYQLGLRGDPTAAYQNAAAMSSADAAQNSGDVGALLRAYALNRTSLPAGY